MKNLRMYFRFSQIVGLLLGARIFVLVFYAFTFYVSTFFLFNRELSPRSFVFDYKVQGIIFCSLLSIAAGGLINQFYDREKDRLQMPFIYNLQQFVKQKYFLYTYVLLTFFSLIIAGILSYRIFIFFLIYQFMIWFYSHRLSKVLILNNITYVVLSLYPFFGMLIYFKHFSGILFSMALFLFVLLWIMDVLKDVLTLRADYLFHYRTIPVCFGVFTAYRWVSVLLVVDAVIALSVVFFSCHLTFFVFYFMLSALVLILLLFLLRSSKRKKTLYIVYFLKIWVFVGVLFLLLSGFTGTVD
ncbi:MAG: prenyltransferase [Bergeyella sp.]|nr:prenyltransferase [Bergeyella sp.]